MSGKRGKRKLEEISGSHSGSQNKDDGGAIPVCELGHNRRVSVKMWKGSVLIDIREYYQEKGEAAWRPGKKGISLSMDQWKVLKDNVGKVDDALKTMIAE